MAICGIYVSHLGLKATQTVEVPIVKLYAVLITLLGIGVILCRVLWAVDMIVQAKHDINAHQHTSTPTDNTSDPSKDDGNKGNNRGHNTDDYYGGNEQNHLSPEKLLFYFSIQIVIIAIVYSTTWAFCVSRAVRFRNAVVGSQIRDHIIQRPDLQDGRGTIEIF